MDDEPRNDEELARLVAAGDEGAFSALYRRYFGRLYDFALRLARDRDTAALVVQSSFLGAYQELRAGEPHVSFRAQLFFHAHHDIVQRLRRRRGPVLEGEEAFAAPDPGRLDPALAGELPDLTRALWQAARSLRLDDYELLDLSARQRLGEDEVAAVLRTRPESVQVRLRRALGELEASFAALLLMGRGRRQCLDLDFLAGEASWSSGLRRRVLRHLQGCAICQATRRRYPSATEVLAALRPVPAPPGWEQTMLGRLQAAARGERPAVAPASVAQAPAPVAPAPAPSAARPPERLPEPAGMGGGLGGWLEGLFQGGGPRTPLLVVLGGGLLAIALIFAALCGTGAFDGGGPAPTPSPTATGTGTPTRTGTPTATSTPTETPTLPPPPPTATPPPTAPPAPTSTPVPPTQPPPQPTRRPTPTPLAPTLPKETPEARGEGPFG